MTASTETRVRLTIGTEGAAFADDNGCAEVARILRRYADRIESGVFGPAPDSIALHDINGNRVGEIEWR